LGELDEHKLAAWRAFITAHARVIEIIDRELTAAGRLPLQWYDVLIELAEAPERRLRLHELADRVVLTRSTLTRLVDRLEAEGYLRRERADDDRRGAYAVLTDQGHEALRAAWPLYSAGINRYFGCLLSDAEVDTLTQALNRVLDAARADRAGGS
jgi:DNA-binding MarR family transcriptional regulator